MAKTKVTQEKSIWKSKTVWINALMIGAALMTEVAGMLGTEGSITVMGLVNFVMRYITKGPVSIK